MKVEIGMIIKATSVQGEPIEGEVLKIYTHTLVVLSNQDSLRYLVKLTDLESSPAKNRSDEGVIDTDLIDLVFRFRKTRS